MLEFFLKHQKIILRAIGGTMLLLGFIVHFWLTPKEGISRNDLAAANVARMEASISGRSASTQGKKSTATHIMSALEEQQKKQMEYFTIMVMILGIGSLGYSFIKKDEEVA